MFCKIFVFFSLNDVTFYNYFIKGVVVFEVVIAVVDGSAHNLAWS